jgi:hypothetical protein
MHQSWDKSFTRVVFSSVKYHGAILFVCSLNKLSSIKFKLRSLQKKVQIKECQILVIFLTNYEPKDWSMQYVVEWLWNWRGRLDFWKQMYGTMLPCLKIFQNNQIQTTLCPDKHLCHCHLFPKQCFLVWRYSKALLGLWNVAKLFKKIVTYFTTLLSIWKFQK